MVSKNHIYIYTSKLPTSNKIYTYLNLDADLICVPTMEIGDEFHYVLKVLESVLYII